MTEEVDQPTLVTARSGPTAVDEFGPDRRRFGLELSAAVERCLDEPTLTRAHRRIQHKALYVGAWYIGSYLLLLLAGSWWLGIVACTSLAVSMAGVGFNIQHDANHNALFRTRGSKRLSAANRAVGWSMYALGASATQWIRGHVQVHHSATNVVGKDYDIELKAFGRLAPQQTRYPWHRFQHLYLWALYCFTAVSIIVADVIATVTESFTGDRHGKRPSVGDYTVLLDHEGGVRVRDGRRTAALPPVVDRDARGGAHPGDHRSAARGRLPVGPCGGAGHVPQQRRMFRW